MPTENSATKNPTETTDSSLSQAHRSIPVPGNSRCRSSRLTSRIAILAIWVLGLYAGAASALLNLGVEAGPLPAVPGQQLYVEIIASNTDVADETSVTMELVLPAGIEAFQRSALTGPWISTSCTQIAPNTTCEAGETIFWNLVTLSGGQSVMATLAPVVDVGFGPGNVTFAASLLQSAVPLVGVNAVVPVVATQNLQVTIESDRRPVENTSLYTYTLHYGNRSSTTSAPASTLEFVVPAGTSFVSATDGAVLIGSTVTWALGSLGPGESGERRVTLQTGSLASGTLLVARADFFDTSLPVQAAEAIALTEVDSSDGLQLGIELAPDPAEPGEQLAVELMATNRSTSALVTTTMNLRLPEGIEPFDRSLLTGLWVSTSCTQIGANNTCESGEEIIWGLVTLDPGQSRTATLPPLVAAEPDGTLIDFRANVSAGGDERAAANSALAVESIRDLSVTVDEDRNPVAPGTNYDYLLHFGNGSTSTTAPNAQLQLELPPDTTFVTASDGGVLIGNTVKWSLGSLLPGAEGDRSVTLQMGAGLVDGALVTARVELRDTSSPAQEVRARTLTEVDAFEVLQLAIELAPDPAEPGEQLAVELMATNRSTSALVTTTVTLRLPEGIEPFARSLLTGLWVSTSCTQIGVNNTCESGEEIIWSLVTLDPGQSRTGTLPPLVAAVDDGTLIQFRAEANGGGDANALASETLSVRSGRNLSVSVDEDRNPVAPGTSYDYRLHFGNRSTSATAASAALELGLPADTSFVSASGGGLLVGNTVQWSLGSLLPGDEGTRDVTLQMGAGLVDGTLVPARVELRDGSSPAQEARAHTLTEVDAVDGLQLALEVAPDPADPGEQLAVELTATNRTTTALGTTSMRLRLPEGIEPFDRSLLTGLWVSTSCTQIGVNNTCESGEEIIWNLITLDAGQSRTGTLPPLVAAVDDGTLIQFRAESTGGGDANALASETLAVRADRDLVVSIETDRNPVAPGSSHDYRLHFGNRSASASATSAELRMTLPRDSSFVSASNGGTLVGNDVVWSLGTVDPEESGLRTATLLMGAGVPDGQQVMARARLTASGASPGLVRATTVTEADAVEALELTLDVGPFDPGGSFSIDATITNTSGVSVELTDVTLRLPDDIDSFDRTDIQGPWVSSTCSQLGSNSTCEAGEEILWQTGTLSAGQSVVGRIPVVSSVVALGSLIDFRAVATGANDARAETSRTVPEPGMGGMIVVGAGLLTLLVARRRQPDRDS